MSGASTITGYLVADHGRLHALLAKAAGSDPFDEAAYTALRAALLRHIAIEEKLLFSSVFRASGGAPIPRAQELRMDHAALTSLLVPTPDAALCAEIEALLETHDAKEEGSDGVYAECERRLGEAESALLAAKAESFPSIRVAVHFDGPGTVRTAALALESARRIKPTRRAG